MKTRSNDTIEQKELVDAVNKGIESGEIEVPVVEKQFYKHELELTDDDNFEYNIDIYCYDETFDDIDLNYMKSHITNIIVPSQLISVDGDPHIPLSFTVHNNELVLLTFSYPNADFATLTIRDVNDV